MGIHIIGGSVADDTVAADRATGGTEDAEAPSATWVIATAAPHHATGNPTLITGLTPHQDDIFVHEADGAPMPVLGCGDVVTDDVVLPDVWYVPGLTTNLVSVSQLSELDHSVGFGRTAWYVRSAADGAIVGEARITGEGGLFEVDFLKVQLGI
uniref:Retrovirus-related Pol polyprotein from transposon TNT 1-94-like beta-barrel domain-containing protein n=1 Tax=Setaria viridis TaxID=4556 RepID=A0A4U6TJ48_SETVI|nr:hypothetical protein SEVIR_8G243800v2 [Setaria viridis]